MSLLVLEGACGVRCDEPMTGWVEGKVSVRREPLYFLFARWLMQAALGQAFWLPDLLARRSHVVENASGAGRRRGGCRQSGPGCC